MVHEKMWCANMRMLSKIWTGSLQVVSLYNLMQELEHMSIREAASKVGLTQSTSIRKIKEWNELTNSFNQGFFHYTVDKKEREGRKVILQDVHTVFIFKLLINEPSLAVETVTDQLCATFKDIQITPR
ncbi:hypothetical protein BD770DRAFT_411846 [Pilaira anomala]|nr:hypothetical protein BD770DRAFT_411846 [Pilaira anomala]